MAGRGSDGQAGQSDEMRLRLRRLASDLKGRAADADASNPARPKAAAHAQAVVEDEPWDSASAEALLRTYEGEVGLVPAALPMAVGASAPIYPAAQSNGEKTNGVKTNGVQTRGVPSNGAPSAPPATAAGPIYFADPPVTPPAVAAPVSTLPSAPAKARVSGSVQSAPAAPVSALMAQAVAPATSALSLLASDRAWLDERLNDLNAKVESTLSSFDPAPFVGPLTERVDRLEDQLIDALSTIAQKTDLEPFNAIHADVAAIKEHVETTRDQLRRLDGIEGHLKDLHAFAEASQTSEIPAAALADPAADQRLTDIEAMVRELHGMAAEQMQPQAVEAPDFHGLAEKAADRAAANVVAQYSDLFAPAKRAELAQQLAGGLPASTGPSLEDMQMLLDAYQEEQRREASQTAATLTTMQEALIRLIDRIEELAGEGVSDETQLPEQQHAGQQFVDVADERGHMPGRRGTDQSAAPQVTVEQARMAQRAAEQAQAAAKSRPQAPAQQQMQPLDPAPTLATAPSRATRTPRGAEAASVPPAAEDDPAAAAAAMAAERARVQAERAQGRRASMPRPQMQVAAEPEADVAATVDDAPVKQATSKVKVIGGLAATALVLAGGAMLAQSYLGRRVSDNAKLGDRIPPAAVTAPVPSSVARPAIPTETFGAQTPRTETASPVPAAPLPTPPLPEAQQSRDLRPQPATGQPLPVQPQPRAAPLPQAAPQPQGRTQEPAGAPRRASPETVTDDLSESTQPTQDAPAQKYASIAGAMVTAASVHGIALDGAGTMPDPSELARRQTRLAPTESVEPASEAIARGRPEMPPATIGPTSLRVAAQQGDPGAAFEVGVRYAEAKGVKQDFQQALIWYSRAAQQGFGPAQYRLATIYEGGLHGAQDHARAKVWYKRAAELGHVKAMHNLAVLAAGNGAAQADYPTAARWFAEAADRGLHDSQFNLAVLHESGLGVAKDQLQAYKWFALAARSGDKEALRRRDQLMATFTPQAAQAAEKLVQAWRARPTDMKANDPRAAAQAFNQHKSQQFNAMQQQQMQAAQLRPQQQEPAPKAAPGPVQHASPPAKAARTTASTTPLPR